MLTPYEDATFAPGQVWELSGLGPSARLVVLRVEQTRDGEVIVHVAVEGVELEVPGGVQSRIGHLPFARSAVAESVTVKAGKAELPPFEDGYRLWREAFEKGEGGVFAIPVAEAVAVVAKSIAQ